jgi:hypothetical protein
LWRICGILPDVKGRKKKKMAAGRASHGDKSAAQPPTLDRMARPGRVFLWFYKQELLFASVSTIIMKPIYIFFNARYIPKGFFRWMLFNLLANFLGVNPYNVTVLSPAEPMLR